MFNRYLPGVGGLGVELPEGIDKDPPVYALKIEPAGKLSMG
jgi:hypothetical protein